MRPKEARSLKFDLVGDEQSVASGDGACAIGRAADLMMTGRRIDAGQALEIGLLEYLFADDSFDTEVCSLLDRLAAAPADAIGAIKRGLELGASGGLDAVFAFEAARQPQLFLSQNGREGVAAFREKRTPRFD